MQIYSPFKDYYDSLLSLGQDPLVTYHRTSEEWNLGYDTVYGQRRYPPQVPDEVCKLGELLNVFGRHKEIELALIGFCGKLYLGFRWQLASFYNGHRYEVVPDRHTRWYYDVEPIKETFPELHEPSVKLVAQASNLDVRHWWAGLSDEQVPRIIYERLRRYNEQNLDDLFREQVKAPVFLLTHRTYTINPELQKLQFFRVVDAPSAFQQLEAYLSNIFLGQYPMPAPLTEKQQVTRYGFDETYGFRTRPGQKHKK